MYSMDSVDFTEIQYIFEEIMYELGLDMEVIMTILGIAAIAAIVSALFNFLMYIFRSVAYCSVARRRGIKHGWLAWFPLGREWITGCIADQYKYTTVRKVTKFRVAMLVLTICAIVLSGILSAVSVANLASFTESVMAGVMEEDVESLLATCFATSTISSLLSLLSSGLSIAIYVMEQIMLYYYYSSCCPKAKVALLILGILFPITIPFFLFCNRKKDQGMVPVQIQQPAPYGAYNQ